MEVIRFLGRSNKLFNEDVTDFADEIEENIRGSSFLVIGGAGSIGQAVTLELFRHDPKLLHVVDISENNLVELVRTIRSSIGHGTGEFKTFAIDYGSSEFDALIKSQNAYDYVFNLSALKHVRSEKDPYTLMRMTVVNILNTVSSVKLTKQFGTKNYFCVSTDKAANPVNMMGASKKIMEMFLMRESLSQKISMARFANVAFSDGSLLHGFNQRFLNGQPFSAPRDVRRYFMSSQEAGELCVFSGLLGENRNIFFPKLNKELDLTSFSDLAIRYLTNRGYEPFECQSEDEARIRSNELISSKKWPCYFFETNTTGEKEHEEFFTSEENLDMNRFVDIGVIQNSAHYNNEDLNCFWDGIMSLRKKGYWDKADIIELYSALLPNFKHKETGKYLDDRM